MSSARQIEGDSERRQVDAAEAFAVRHGLRLAPPMRDLGVSAFKGRHRKTGALGLFIQGIRAGEIPPGTLIIEAVDRLSREPPLMILKLLTEILEAGFVIHILSAGWTLDLAGVNASPLALQSIVSNAQLAHAESVLKSQRISAAYVNRRAQARAGKVLRGAYHPAWLSRTYHPDGTVTHTPIPAVVDAVRTVFELFADGMGAHTVAQILNQRGVPVVPAHIGKGEAGAVRQANRRWYQAYTGRLVMDRRVLGEYQPMIKVEGKSVPEGEPIPGHYPQIISDELWNRVQAGRNPKHGRRTGPRMMRVQNLLTNGLARCAHCGGNMLVRGDFRGGTLTGRQYLRCAANQQGGQCDNRAMPRYNWLEGKLLAALPGLPWTDLLRKNRGPDPRDEVRAEMAKITVEIERRNAASARLLKILESDDEPDPEISTRRRALRGEVAELERNFQGFAAELNAMEVAAGTEDRVAEDLAALIAAMETEDQIERANVRMKIHGVLRRVIIRVDFHARDPNPKGTGRPLAVAHIRGGQTLVIPLDAESPVQSYLLMSEVQKTEQEMMKRGIDPYYPDAYAKFFLSFPAE